MVNCAVRLTACYEPAGSGSAEPPTFDFRFKTSGGQTEQPPPISVSAGPPAS